LLVTHDNRILLDIADRIIHMEDGRLVEEAGKQGIVRLVNTELV